MKRRDFIAGLGGAAAAAWPRAARAQQLGRVRHVSVLMAYAASDPAAQTRITAFERGLESLGWMRVAI